MQSEVQLIELIDHLEGVVALVRRLCDPTGLSLIRVTLGWSADHADQNTGQARVWAGIRHCPQLVGTLVHALVHTQALDIVCWSAWSVQNAENVPFSIVKTGRGERRLL
jgi:hypothetical protein